jgi:hypothetical protein
MKLLALMALVALCACAGPSKRLHPARAGFKPAKALPAAKLAEIKAKADFLRDARMIRFGWGDCPPQQPGTWYQVFTSTNLVDWELFAETYNHFLDIPCIRPGLNVFKVRTTNGEKHSDFGGGTCP